MNDFASSAMLRLIHHGIKNQGIAIPNSKLSMSTSAHTSFSGKRAFLQALEETVGSLAVLKIGLQVKHVQDEPALTALALASSPMDLIARWQRLERFIHSRHRIETMTYSDTSAELLHYSTTKNEAPTSAENSLVFGVIIGLLQLVGVEGITARVAGSRRRVFNDGHWLGYDAAGERHNERWVITWRLTQHKENKKLFLDNNWLTELQSQIETDLTRSWKLPMCAEQMGVSTRTLQRRLAESGNTFTNILQSIRLKQSAKLLVTSHQSPSQIGYACGFTDQAHFTRTFKKHTAFSPIIYRKQFSPTRVGSEGKTV
jgi:AraC-like DNA-binding protein